MKELIEKLENYYDFQCEAGDLKNCGDWIELKERVETLEHNILELMARHMEALNIINNHYKQY